MTIKKHSLYLALVVCPWMLGCHSDAPTRPSEREAANLVQALAVTMQQGIVAAQAGKGAIQGVSGQFRVVDVHWLFERYSPEGEVFIDGEMMVDPVQQPMIVYGELDLAGALSGTLIIDLSYNLTSGRFSGTIAVDGVRIAVSERLCCVTR